MVEQIISYVLETAWKKFTGSWPLSMAISWLNRFRITPESTDVKYESGALITISDENFQACKGK